MRPRSHRAAREDVLFDAGRTVAGGGTVVDAELVAVPASRRTHSRQLGALTARELGTEESTDDHRRVLAILRWLGRPD